MREDRIYRRRYLLHLHFTPGRSLVRSTLCMLFVGLFAFGSQADAQLVTDCVESGGDLVCTTTGSVNITGQTFSGNPDSLPVLNPSDAGFQIFTTGAATSADSYAVLDDPNFSEPAAFGANGFHLATSSSGAPAGMLANIVAVPVGYVSGAALPVSTATWANESIASLGLIPGSYVWSWGTGPTAGSATLNIIGSPIPEPTSLALFAISLGTIVSGPTSLRRRRD